MPLEFLILGVLTIFLFALRDFVIFRYNDTLRIIEESKRKKDGYTIEF